MTRLLNLCLLIAALVGGYLAVQAGREHRRVLAEHRRMQAQVGFLRVEDAERVYVVALPTEDPLHFAWRVYLPANYEHVWASSTDGGSGHSHRQTREAQHEIVRVRFRQIDGRWHQWVKTPGGSQFRSGRFPQSRAMLADPAQRSVRQLGMDEVKSFAPDEVITLLAIRDLESEPHENGDDRPPIRFRLTSRRTWDKGGKP